MAQPTPVALGYPVEEYWRELLRTVDRYKRHKLPAIVSGSIQMPCHECKIMLWVGPFVHQALLSVQGIRLMCPFCLIDDIKSEPTLTAVLNLNNPESRPED